MGEVKDGIGEVVATAGLVALIFLLARTGRHVLSAVAVGAQIIGAAIGLGVVVSLFPDTAHHSREVADPATPRTAALQSNDTA